MGYQVKWMEEHLGVTRKALRIMEEKKLLPPNLKRGYRDYSIDEVKKIWNIKTLQNIGFTYKEIGELLSGDSVDVYLSSLKMKIAELEKEKENIEKHISYAKMISLSGRFFELPIEFEEETLGKTSADVIRFMPDEILKKVNEIYDTKQEIESVPEDYDIESLLNIIQKLAPLASYMSKPEEIAAIKIYPKEIVKRMNQGYEHPEVQLLAELIYETENRFQEGKSSIPRKEFAKYKISYYLYSKYSEESEFTQQERMFLSNAFSYFAGYINFQELIKETENGN